MKDAVLLNVRCVTNGDGFVRKINLDFKNKHKHDVINIRPGMSRSQVAKRLRTAAERISVQAPPDS